MTKHQQAVVLISIVDFRYLSKHTCQEMNTNKPYPSTHIRRSRKILSKVISDSSRSGSRQERHSLAIKLTQLIARVRAYTSFFRQTHVSKF